MIKFVKSKWILIAIILIASFLRLWKLGNIPGGFTPDEASLGYNSYSILKTAKDEYGKTLPMVFKSFGDYKPGLYVYLLTPFTAMLGLNEFSTRLPSAVAGIFSIYLIYLIVNKLFPSHKSLGLVAAFVSSINPWLIYFSRGAWEANVSLSLTLIGIYLFLKSIDDGKWLVSSGLVFGLTLLTYQGAKLSTAIVIVILVVSYWKDFWKISNKYIVSSALVGVVVALPIVLSIFSGSAGRLSVFSVFSYPRPKDYTQAFLDEGGEKFGSISYYLFHSEALNFKRGIMGRWFNHFSGKYLFFDGDYQNPRHSPPYQGMMLLSDLITILIGMFILFKSDENSKSRNFILLWLILSPLPSALSRDQVHAVRSLNMAIPLIVISSIGFYYLLKNSRKLFGFYLFFLILAIVYFADSYFVHLNAHNSKYWYYGWKEVVNTVTPIQSSYKKIYVQQSYDQPYIYFLYFQKYSPIKYQYQASLTIGANVSDVGLVGNLGNIVFENLDWQVIKRQPGVLVIANPTALPPDYINDAKVIKEIKYPDGNIAFNIFEIK